MHARVSEMSGGSAGPEAREQLQRTVTQVEALDGFRGMIVMARPGGGLRAITMWESEDALQRSEQAANRLRQEAAEGTGTRIEGVEVCEVLTAQMAGQPMMS